MGDGAIVTDHSKLWQSFAVLLVHFQFAQVESTR